MGDKRRSGFLIPNAKYTTTNYFEFTAILLEHRAKYGCHHHAALYASSWQYHVGERIPLLSRAGAGLMELDYLPSDKVYKDEHPNDDSSRRWLFTGTTPGHGSWVWRFNVDYTKVSDPSYFNDFDNKYGSSTDGHATQNSALAMRCKTSRHRFNQQFRVFSEQNTSSYWQNRS